MLSPVRARNIVLVALVACSLLLVGGTAPAGATPRASAAAPAPERGTGFAPSTRAAAELLYNTQYRDTHDNLLNWTGSVSGCQDGTTGDLFKEGVLNRINYFRAMAGVPDDIVLSPAANAQAQGAALLMAANQDLDHAPPDNWTCWTQARDDAAGNSNLAQGLFGAAAIDGYMQDGGATNTAVGHRRWLLFPETQEMGTGDVQMPSWQSTTNALVVFDGHLTDPVLDLRDDYVAWPPPFFVPTPVVYPRWSLSLPGAEFTGATVTMTRGGNPVTVTKLTPQSGYGLPSLVWEPTTDLTTAGDFHVSVTGITGVGVPSSIAYDVHTFVPDVNAPTADVRTPAAGAVYPQGTTLTADFDCSDTGGSGLASCTGTTSDGQALDTTTLGSHPFSVTASDGAGLVSIVDRPYTVAQRPDVAASVGAGGTVVGDGTYATTVTVGQTVTGPVARGATRTFVARLGNDAATSASFRLRASGTATSGFTVKIVRDGVDITAAALAGTYPVNDLAPGATVSVKVKVTATTASAGGAARNVDLTLSSTAGPSAKDKVRVRAVRS